jgi:hypothetical protein
VEFISLNKKKQKKKTRFLKRFFYLYSNFQMDRTRQKKTYKKATEKKT